MHENLSRHESLASRPGSERSFGFVFAVVFALVAAYPLLHGAPVRWWATAVALACASTALIAPSLLAAPNRLWFRFGLFLGGLVAPVAIGAVYLLSVVPVGLAMRAFGKDPLRLKLDASASSYWIERTPPGPDPSGMRDQF